MAELRGDGAHVVGFSLGGLVALLAAAARPDRVKSLLLIEPGAMSLARGHAAVEELIAAMEPAYSAALSASEEEFLALLDKAWGGSGDLSKLQLTPAYRKGIRATMLEGRPWTVAVPSEVVKAAPWPKLVVSGGWNPAFEAMSDAVARAIGAERAVITESGHRVQGTGQPFNDLPRQLVG